LRDGLWQNWREDGSLASEESWRLGVRNGSWRVLSSSGQLEVAEVWRAGKRHGTWVQHDAAGVPLHLFQWEQGTLVGVEALGKP
jgi:antitoxin component YwqK of YwqJK toxin-antitoxin module